MSKKNAGDSSKVKTNAMRILDKAGVKYDPVTYDADLYEDGNQLADGLGLPREIVYKTIVTTGKSGEHYVFVIPVEHSIDFKKAAKAAGEKSIELLPLKMLTDLTGYVRGGCTSVGMKKQFPVIIDITAEKLPFIYVSGGKRGVQLKLAPGDLLKAARAKYADVLEIVI